MEEKDDLDLKAEIDQISRKIDNILNKIEETEATRPDNQDKESQ